MSVDLCVSANIQLVSLSFSISPSLYLCLCLSLLSFQYTFLYLRFSASVSVFTSLSLHLPPFPSVCLSACLTPISFFFSTYLSMSSFTFLPSSHPAVLSAFQRSPGALQQSPQALNVLEADS